MRKPGAGTLQKGELAEQELVKNKAFLFLSIVRKTNSPIDSVETCERGPVVAIRAAGASGC